MAGDCPVCGLQFLPLGLDLLIDLGQNGRVVGAHVGDFLFKRFLLGHDLGVLRRGLKRGNALALLGKQVDDSLLVVHLPLGVLETGGKRPALLGEGVHFRRALLDGGLVPCPLVGNGEQSRCPGPVEISLLLVYQVRRVILAAGRTGAARDELHRALPRPSLDNGGVLLPQVGDLPLAGFALLCIPVQMVIQGGFG